ncbi:HU family DNA-binding protein [Sorangium sp. So ce327]|uniref:HU family DNA-binding protein n=2 Tax=Sorangium TaxID=39643 RepID=UPI003F61446C
MRLLERRIPWSSAVESGKSSAGGGPLGWGRSTMTKSELIDAIAGRGELTKARAELVVNCVFDAMTQALQRNEGIEIRGFGSFTVRPYKPYSGRNPRTGQPVPVPAKRLPFFKVGKELKELVNASRAYAISGDDDDEDEDDEETDDE